MRRVREEVVPDLAPQRLMWATDWPIIEDRSTYFRALSVVRDEMHFLMQRTCVGCYVIRSSESGSFQRERVYREPVRGHIEGLPAPGPLLQWVTLAAQGFALRATQTERRSTAHSFRRRNQIAGTKE